ncbi:MAG: hypothetical protein RSD47_07580 [Romboutsia sp.]
MQILIKILIFRELSKILVKLETFVDFEFKDCELQISNQEYQDYKSKYFTIYEMVRKTQDEKVSILLDVDFEYSKFEAHKRIQEVNYFADEIGLSADFISDSVAEYEYCGIINREEISNEVKEKLKPKFLERKRKVEQVKSFVYEHVAKYNI